MAGWSRPVVELSKGCGPACGHDHPVPHQKPRFLTPAPDTNKHERRRSTPNLSGQPAEAQNGLTDVDSSR